jgi:hypothetical protein
VSEGFKIADGYVDVHAKYERSEVETVAEEVGRQAGTSHTTGFTERLRDERGRFVTAAEDVGRESGSGHTTGFSERLRDERGRFTRAVEDAVDPEGSGGKTGRRFGMAMVRDAGSAFTGGFTNAVTLGLKGSVPLTEAFASNPYAAAAGLAIGVGMAAPAGAALTAGLGLALSGGALGLGAWLVRDRPEVKAAAKSLGDTARQTFKDAATPMVGPIADALKTFQAGITSIAPQMKQMFATVAPEVKPLADGLVGMVKNALPGFLDFLKQSQPMMKTLADKLPIIGTALSKFFDSLSKGGPGANKFLGDFLALIASTIVFVGRTARMDEQGVRRHPQFLCQRRGCGRQGRQVLQ